LLGAESLDVKLNYYAMAVAILAECNIETAFEKLQSDHPDMVSSRHTLTPEDTEDMRKIKAEGITWKALGEIYCIPETTAYRRLRHRKEKVS